MCKRLFVTAVLCVGLMAIMGVRDAKAWPRITGWGLSGGSVHCDACSRGIHRRSHGDYHFLCEIII